MRREDVARLTAQGLSDREVGEALGVSARTVFRRRKAWGIPPIPPAEQVHGTRGAYARGCRCDDCRAAWRVHQREYRSGATQLTMAAARYGEPWTPEEDRLVLELGMSVAAALAVGRTYQATCARVRRLRTQGAATAV